MLSCETWLVWRLNVSGHAGIIFVDNSDHLQSHPDSEDWQSIQHWPG